MKFSEILKLSDIELNDIMVSLRKELRSKKLDPERRKTSSYGIIRRDIARVLTLVNGRKNGIIIDDRCKMEE